MSGGTTIRDLVLSARPRQWVKNVFVLAPLVFAKRALDPSSLGRAAAAFLLFCLASAAVYLFNDLLDLEQDRQHPEKCGRPLASGRLRPRVAGWVAGVLAGASLLGAVAWNPVLFGLLAGYLGLNLAYSTRMKHVAYVDVLFIAVGFLLRVIGGAAAIPVEISGWILLCTLFLSLYLGLGKRLHERLVLPPESGRRVLRHYSPRTAVLLLAGSGVLTLATFVLYTLSDRVLEHFGTRALVSTSPLVALGLLRFGQMVRSTAPRSPTDALVTDLPFLAVALGWVIAVVLLVYV